jgi:acetyl-CoA carboxylase biotin carboxyl carrier protein
MDIIKTTNELAQVLKDKDLGSIFVRNGDLEISVSAKVTQYQFAAGAAPAPIPAAVGEAVPAAAASETAAVSGNAVVSPMVGTFYSAPAPEKPPFVKVGDKVTKGQIVCIVEAMKLMNEIPSEFDGTVTAILVKDGELVDFGKEMIVVE